MTTLAAPRPEIRLVLPAVLPTDLPEAALLAWLRAALPGGFVHLAQGAAADDAGFRVFLHPDLGAHVAHGLEQGRALPDLLAEWAALARVIEAAGAEGFALDLGALARDPAAMAQALAQWCPAAAGDVDLPALMGEPSSEDALVEVLIAAFLTAEPAALPGSRPAPDAAGVAAAAARLGADRAALTREAAARREAAGWLAALRRTLWSEADRAAQAEARLRAMESRLAEVSRAAAPPAPDPALVERIAHLEETLAAREAYIHKVHHSKSWAVTAPLRRFSRLLRRG